VVANARNVARALRPVTKAGPGGARQGAVPQMGQPYVGSVSPFAMESQPGGSWANAYGGFLPRPPDAFTQGAFGPFQPIYPVPVDAPPSEDAQRAEPRRWQYEVGYNLPVGQPGSEGLKLADFGTLKTLADLYSVARACIQLRKAEVRGLEWDITPTKEASKAMRGDKAAMKDFGSRRGEAVKFFNKPDPDYFTWNTWLDALLEQIFVFDALALLIQPKWSRGTGKGLLGSDLDSLQLISGPTIRPLLDMRGGKPRPPAPAYQQYLYGVPRSDLMTVVTGRDLEESGLTGSQWTQFRGDQLLYIPMEPRRETPYGFPPIERALIPVMAGLQKQAYQLDFFREGTVPAVYISPGGANSNLTPNQIRELQDALNAIAGDPAYKHKILVLPADSKVMPQKPIEIADQFDEIVMNQVCMAFDIQPMELGIMPKVSTTASTGAANQMAKATANMHERKATKPLLKFLADIFDYILQDVCGQEDMQFTFEGLEEDEDEETLTTLLASQINVGLRSVDEGREALGLQPWSLPETSDPLWGTPTGAVPLGQIGQQGEPAPGQQPNANNPATNAPGAQQGQAKPGNAGQSPGHDAAEASTQSKPSAPAGSGAASSSKPASGGSSSQPAKKGTAAQIAKAASHQSRRDEHVAAATGALADRLREVATSFERGEVTAPHALDTAVAALAAGYRRVMTDAARHARSDHPVTAVKDEGDDAYEYVDPSVESAATQRAEGQRTYLMGLLMTLASGKSVDDLSSRLDLYTRSLNTAYNVAYGQTVQADHPHYEVIWHLGVAEHCKLCIDRDGKVFTFDSLPGWPGDGGFGGMGAVCLGGPNCHCSLEYRQPGAESLYGHNTQRPDSVGYYRQQLDDITAAREQAAAAREDFLGSIPAAPAMRASTRDQIRRELADLQNRQIRQSGGYPGVSVEPLDIAAADVAALVPDWAKSRSAQAELEALGRHLRKGRLISTWEPRNIPNVVLARIAEHMARGLDPDTAIRVVKATRRVNANGEEYWESDEPPEPNPAGGGAPSSPGGVAGGFDGSSPGGEPPRWDASSVAPYMDSWPQGGHGTAQAPVTGIGGGTRGRSPNGVGKGAADLADPNPVEAEHVMNQMRRNYPEKSIGWMKDARWIGPVAIPLDRIDFDDQDKWAANHEKARVKHFAKQIKKGDAHLHPAVAVQEPGDDKIKIIDGHHRTLAYKKLGMPVKAYVGFVDSDGGPWDKTHVFQFHQGQDPQNKAATLSKESVNYRQGTDAVHRCRNCSMFVVSGDDDSGECTLVKGVIASDAVCDRWDAKVDKAARGYDINPRSGMISLDIEPGIVPQHPGGVTDHHITVVYLGRDLTDEQWNTALERAMDAAAKVAGPIVGMVAGVDSFTPSSGSDWKIPVFAPVTIPAAHALRDALADLSASEHKDWHPHVTLAYLDEGDPMPDAVPATPVTFTHLSVHLGDHVERIPFGTRT
jgi:2'-5' RNA ligase